jgi:DNA-binding FadR family transcriptional regulator
MSSEAQLKFSLGKIRVPKASEILTNFLREKILDGTYAAGESLPTERELAEVSGLSRASVREALRMLETEGLISTRTGRTGGSAVQLPGQDALDRSIDLFVRAQRIRFGTLLEVRETTEPQLARLAALHRTEADLERLERLHAEMAKHTGPAADWTDLNVAWHEAVATASHNSLLVAFWRAISRMMRAAANIDVLTNTPALVAAVLKVHRQVLDAIRAGDGDAAARRMGRHVKAYSEYIRAHASKDIVLSAAFESTKNQETAKQ